MTEQPYDLFSYAAQRTLSPPQKEDLLDGIPEQVINLFERLSLEVHQRGHERYSARAVIHRIRWHFHIERGDRDFKCNDHWTPPLARWFMKNHPEVGEFFETRRARSDEQE